MVNWNSVPADITVQVEGIAGRAPAATWSVPGVGFAAYQIPDAGDSAVWLYGEDERAKGLPPEGRVSL